MYQVQNKHAGCVVLTHDHEEYRWEGLKDPSFRDVIEIPEHVRASSNFRRLEKRGLLEIVADQESYMEEAGAQWRAQEEEAKQALLSHIDKNSQRTLGMSVGCIGPGPRGTGQACGKNVFVQDIAAAPPLCEEHQTLANHFYYQIDESTMGDKGKWKLARMDRSRAEQNRLENNLTD